MSILQRVQGNVAGIVCPFQGLRGSHCRQTVQKFLLLVPDNLQTWLISRPKNSICSPHSE